MSDDGDPTIKYMILVAGIAGVLVSVFADFPLYQKVLFAALSCGLIYGGAWLINWDRKHREATK